MEDDTLKVVTHDLTDIVRNAAKTDWQVKEQVRAKLRTRIKRLLLKHGYPPDHERVFVLFPGGCRRRTGGGCSMW